MTELPRPRHPVPALDPIIEAWSRSTEFHQLNQPADDDELNRVESLLGRSFPAAFRAVYEISDGGSYLQGNLMLSRLRGTGSFDSVATLSQDFRDAGSPIPSELVIFGSDGSEDSLALWMPKNPIRAGEMPVIDVGEGGEGLALVGTDLVSFLKGWSAFYLMLIAASGSALDALGVPPELRGAADDERLYALREWADPHLSDARADPYVRPTNVKDLRRIFGADS